MSTVWYKFDLFCRVVLVEQQHLLPVYQPVKNFRILKKHCSVKDKHKNIQCKLT